MNPSSKIFVAGHSGLLGQSLIRRLKASGYNNLLLASLDDIDLTQQQATFDFLAQHKPDIVILAAARVGGIKANMTYPAEFLYQNLMIQSNVIHGSYLAKVKQLLFLGSSCMYPRECLQPMKEEYVLTAPFEKSNEGYAIAKTVGVKQCEFYNRQYQTQFMSLTPTNLYGPGDNFDLETSHVIPALIHKMHIAKEQQQSEVRIWGAGKARREFLFVDDLAEAIIFVLNHYQKLDPLNVGTGTDVTIATLTQMIKDVVGFEGKLVFETDKQEGPPQKLLDVSKLVSLGWKPKHSLEEGLKETYQWFVHNFSAARRHENKYS